MVLSYRWRHLPAQPPATVMNPSGLRRTLGKWFPRAQMMAKALEIWSLHVIEEALGDDADGVLPQAIRCAVPRVRLPRHHIDVLEYRAKR
jgi:hypothetical protein